MATTSVLTLSDIHCLLGSVIRLLPGRAIPNMRIAVRSDGKDSAAGGDLGTPDEGDEGMPEPE